MPKAAEVHAVQTHAFLCLASGGEKLVLMAEMRVKET